VSCSLLTTFPPSHSLKSCLLRHRRAEIVYKVKAVCGLEGMLTANLRHTQRVDIASQPQASLPQQCSVVSEPPQPLACPRGRTLFCAGGLLSRRGASCG
jgi:hypothetical protein